MSTYIVIPVFDHDEQLRSLILALSGRGYSNIVVVDDGSTHDIFNKISDLNVHFLQHKTNLGQGAALQTGFDYALEKGADVIASFDADGQHEPDDLETVLAPVRSGQADLCMGSRFLSKKPDNITSSRERVLKMATLVNYLFTKIKLTDAHNGLRAINRSALEKIRISENRMAHATEILIEAKKHGLRIIEVPVTINYTDYSKKYGQSSWNSVRILLDLVLYKLFT